jgi:Flp pilus assembly pilin Flp
MLERIQLFLGKAFTFDPKGLKGQEGQTATEYAVVLAVLVIGVGGATIPLRDQIVGFIQTVGDNLAGLLG